MFFFVFFLLDNVPQDVFEMGLEETVNNKNNIAASTATFHPLVNHTNSKTRKEDLQSFQPACDLF